MGNPRHQLLGKSTDAPGRKQGSPRDKAPQITEKHLSAGPQLRVEQHATEERPGKAREKSFTESVTPQQGPGRKGFVNSPRSEGPEHQKEQTKQIGPGDNVRSQRAKERRRPAQGVLQASRTAASDKHGACPEASATQRGKIEMSARRRIGIEEHLEPAVEYKTVRGPLGNRPPTRTARCFAKDKRPPGPREHLRAGRTGQPRANDNGHEVLNTPTPRFEQIFLAPFAFYINVRRTSCTRFHL